MWTGEVERKVWMRRAGPALMASAQRSMSLKAARARPQTTAFLVRLAISWTARKSPSEAIGKTRLDDVDAHLVEERRHLELLLMGHGGARALLAVAQGGVEDHDAVLVGLGWRGRWRGHWMSSFLSRMRPERARLAPIGRSWGSVSAHPLSAQAQTPGRPSGAGKQKESPKNEAAPGFAPGRSRGLSRRIDMLKTLIDGTPRVADNGEWRVNPGAVRMF